MRIVDVLASGGARTPTELARAVRLSSGGLSIALDRLERAGLITRRPSARDRRSVTVDVRDRVRKMGEAFFGELGRSEQDLLSDFHLAELRVLVRFLDGLSERIASYEGPTSGLGLSK